MKDEVLLKCNISTGMFPGEAGVSFIAANGEEISLFCADKYVNRKDAVLMVRIVKKEQSSTTVRLPAESLNGSRFIKVRNEHLKELQVA